MKKTIIALCAITMIAQSILLGDTYGELILYADDPISYYPNTDEMEPYIAVDTDNEDYGLMLTTSGSTNPQDQYHSKVFYYKKNSSGIWDSEEVYPNSQEKLQPYLQFDGNGNALYSFRFSNDFYISNVYSTGNWATVSHGSSWNIDHNEMSLGLLAEPGNSGSIHFLSQHQSNNLRVLKHILRQSNGTYSSATTIFTSNSSQSLTQVPNFDITNNSGNEPIISLLVYDNSSNWKVLVNQNGQNSQIGTMFFYQ